MFGWLIFVGGLAFGAISWAVSPMLSGRFEPFDSGLSLLVGQTIMVVYIGYVGLRYGHQKTLVALIGVYLGQVAYSYLFGGSEARAWVLLGTVTILLLCVFPLIAGLLGVVIGRARRAKD